MFLLEKILIEILEILYDGMNFSYEIISIKTPIFIHPQKKKKYTT